MGSAFLNTTAKPSLPATTIANAKNSNISSVTINVINTPTTMSTEQMRIDYYKTYDVMTGIRIAATLGGFFSLMVLLLVYKSKCKSKSLSEENIDAAVAAAVAAEEQKEANMSAIMDFYSLSLERARQPRRSLGNMSAPIFARGRSRFLSIGGYSSLGTPLFLHYQRGKSLPGSALRFPFHAYENEGEDSGLPSSVHQYQEDIDQEDDAILESPCYHHFLTVPVDSRRLSSITCSSSDTSYLERRGSAMELGMPVPPPFSYKMKRKDSEFESEMLEEAWDFYYPIDIQVIQPTPEMSPCGSEHTLYDHNLDISQTLQPMSSLAVSTSSLLSVPNMAPLASISSCAASFSDYPDLDSHSVGSDSVFMDDDELEDMDTEDDVDGFSTDSDEHSAIPFSQHFAQSRCNAKPAIGRWGVTGAGFQPKRRVSAPTFHDRKNKFTCATISATVDAEDSLTRPSDVAEIPSCSKSCDQLKEENITYSLSRRPPLPLPSDSSSNDSVTMHKSSEEDKIKVPLPAAGTSHSCDQINRISMSPRDKLLALPSFPHLVKGSCEHLAQVLASKDSTPVNENCTWSQETLF